jgi:hypothetical protein
MRVQTPGAGSWQYGGGDSSGFAAALLASLLSLLILSRSIPLQSITFVLRDFLECLFVMSTPFYESEQIHLLSRLLDSFPQDASNILPFFGYIRSEVIRFVRYKMPHAPPHFIHICYTNAIRQLSYIKHGPVSIHYLNWDASTSHPNHFLYLDASTFPSNLPPICHPNAPPAPVNYFCYGPVSNVSNNFPAPNLQSTISRHTDSDFPARIQSINAYAGLPPPSVVCPSNNAELPPPSVVCLTTNLSSIQDGPPAVISLPSQQSCPSPRTPTTTDTRSRSVAFGHDKEEHSFGHICEPTRHLPRSLLPALSNAQAPQIDHLHSPPVSVIPLNPSPALPHIESTSLLVTHNLNPEPAIPINSNVPVLRIDSGTRYELVAGFPPPPEFSSNTKVCDHLSSHFPCPNGRWRRKRAERCHIIFWCSCRPVRNIIRLTLDNDSSLDSCIDYYVPSGQGIPHLDSPVLGDSMSPWEIDILKDLIIKDPNIQPMVAHGSWTTACAIHLESPSRCPGPVPGIPDFAPTKRTLYSTSTTYIQFLGFFRYYRKHQRACKCDLSSPPTSVAYLWSYQTEHSFWDHLRLITDIHGFEPMPPEHFTSIDHLATHLRIDSSMIFTIPVECSDLEDLDLPHNQKMKAFGSLFCFGLPHLWTLCLFLKLDIQHRALLSDFTRLSKTGLHINVVGPCSHQVNRRSKSRITRRKHSLGLQVCPGEIAPAVVLYHKSLQKLAPRVFAGSSFVVSVDSSDQSRAVFKGTLNAHPDILKIPVKVHITRHCVEDVTWRSKMRDKKNFPGRVYNKVKQISLMYGDTLTRKAWELSFKEWELEGEGIFSEFMKRNQGPDSNYGGGKINYSASQIMGVRNDNQPSEEWLRVLKGSEASQTPPVVNLTVNFANFLNLELEKAFRHDTLHVSNLDSLRSAHGSMIARDRSVPYFFKMNGHFW